MTKRIIFGHKYNPETGNTEAFKLDLDKQMRVRAEEERRMRERRARRVEGTLMSLADNPFLAEVKNQKNDTQNI